jgi:hypothetical protein
MIAYAHHTALSENNKTERIFFATSGNTTRKYDDKFMGTFEGAFHYLIPFMENGCRKSLPGVPLRSYSTSSGKIILTVSLFSESAVTS